MKLTDFSSGLRGVLKALGDEAERQGVSIYIVGGVVRDLLLKKKNLDLDVVVEGDALAFARAFARLSAARVKIYPQFKTATVYFKDGLLIDMAMARKEVYRRPGALPEVSAGSIAEDLARRDFTINAMAVKINAGCFGGILDPFGGQKDLARKKIRVLHEKSFVDDPTRILRGVRFEQRLRFLFTPETLRLLKAALRNNAVGLVKPARYFEEFRMLLKEENPYLPLSRLEGLNGLDFLAKSFNGNRRLLSRLANNINSLKKDLFYRERNWPLVYLVAIFFRIGAKDIRRIARRFQLTNYEKQVLSKIPEIDGIIKKLRRRGIAEHKVFQMLEIFEEEIILFIRAQTSAIIISHYVDKFLKRSRTITVEINGNDLREMGFSEGPHIGRALRALRMRKIDGQLPSRQSELAMARELLTSRK